MRLKPCPFCGGSAEIITDYDESYVAMCTQCGALGPKNVVTGYIGLVAAEAVNAWNKRANESKVAYGKD